MEFDLPKNLSLNKFPSQTELVLYLVKAELRNRKFFNGLESLGFDTSCVSSDFSSLIMSLTGFEVRTDEDFEFYNRLVDEYILRIDIHEPDKQLTETAFSFIKDLEVERRRKQQSQHI
jgi:hypothetical protein